MTDIEGVRVAVEVKTRTAASGLDPVEQFDAAKARSFGEAAMSMRPRARRLDLIAVVLGEIVSVRWIRDVC